MKLQNEHLSPGSCSAGRPGSSIVTDEDRGRSRVEEPRRSLLLLFGRIAERDRSVDLGTETLHIGRDPADRFHLQLDDSRVSRHHAEIAWSDIQRRHWIRDLNSRNGVYVNGAKIARAFLAPGDIIRVGNTVFRFVAASEDPSRLRPIEPPFVGTSRSLRLTIDRAFRVATGEASVLVLGPTGTGKEAAPASSMPPTTRIWTARSRSRSFTASWPIGRTRARVWCARRRRWLASLIRT